MRNKYICDICEGETIESTWEDAPSSFSLASYCASQNPLGDLGYGYQHAGIVVKDVCQSCQRRLAKAVAETLIVLKRPKK